MNNDSSKSIKSELIYFKEEVLKDIKSSIAKITTKHDLEKDDFLQKFLKIESKIETLFNKVVALSNSISIDKSLSDKIYSLDKFRDKTQDILQLYDTQLKNQSTTLKEAMYKYDLFINENIYYNGIIGPTVNCKFSNFHQFIDYIIANITKLNNFKDKTINLDYKGYKNKIESTIEILKMEINNNVSNNNKYTNKAVNECEERIKSIIKLYDEKFMEIRLDNHKNINDLKKLYENLSNEMKIKKEDILNIDKLIDNKIEIYHKECINNYENIQKLIKELFNLSYNEKDNNDNKDDKDNKDNKHNLKKGFHAESFLKKYIEGKVGVEQVSYQNKNCNTPNRKNENNSKENNININNNNNYKNNDKINNKNKNNYLSNKNYQRILNNKSNDYDNKKIIIDNISNNTNNLASELYKKDFFLNNINKDNNINNKYKSHSNNKHNKSENNNLIMTSYKNNKKEENNTKINNDNTTNVHSNLNNNHKIYDYNNKNIKKEKTKNKEKEIYNNINELIKVNLDQNETNKKLILSKHNLFKENKNNNKQKKKKSSIIIHRSNDFLINKKENNTTNLIYNLDSTINNNDIKYKRNNTPSIDENNHKINLDTLKLNKNDLNKIFIKSILSGKNSYSKLSLINNSDDDLPYTLSPVLDIQKIPIIKSKKENTDINSNSLNNNIITTNQNNTINNKSNDTSQNIFNIKSDNNLINIINHSNEDTHKIKLNKKNLERYDLSEPKIIFNNNNLRHSKSNNNKMGNKYKGMEAFKNKIEKKLISSKKPKNNMFLYDSLNNSNHKSKNKMEIIAINQVKRSIKNLNNYINNNNDIYSLSDKTRSNIASDRSNSNYELFLK